MKKKLSYYDLVNKLFDPNQIKGIYSNIPADYFVSEFLKDKFNSVEQSGQFLKVNNHFLCKAKCRNFSYSELTDIWIEPRYYERFKQTVEARQGYPGYFISIFPKDNALVVVDFDKFSKLNTESAQRTTTLTDHTLTDKAMLHYSKESAFIFTYKIIQTDQDIVITFNDPRQPQSIALF